MAPPKKIVAVSSSGGHWSQLLRLSPALTGQPKVVAISSKGGHWSEMQRLCPIFAGRQVVFITTQKEARDQVPAGSRFYAVMDSNRWQKVRLAVTMFQVLFVMLREWPEVVLSTGAAPGFFAVVFGKLMGCKTVWIESLANAESPSLSTRLVRHFADLYLTQWKHMARPEGPHYMGSVL